MLCMFYANQLDQFHTLMENRQLTLEEQEKAFENIRTDHEKLRRSYLQAKEDYNVLRRSGWMIVFVCFCFVLSENGTAMKDACCNVFGRLDKMFCIIGGSLVHRRPKCS